MLGGVAERGVVSLGVAAAIGPELAGQLAPAVEEAGFHALWVNETPGTDALAALEAAAATTTRLILATGIVPVDGRPAAQISEEVAARGLPQERLVLGIGSGQTTVGALRLVRDGASHLRRTVSSKVVIGALGPKMRRLAADEADGVLLNWLTPAVAREQTDESHEASARAHVALYVRTALEPAAHARLQAETTNYARIPPYAANFARTGIRAEETVMDAAAQAIAERLEQYRSSVDEVILRAVTPHDTIEDYLRFIEQARALL